MQPFKVSEHGKATKGICFIFGAWRFGKLGYIPGIKRMNRAGIKCVLFVPSPKLITIQGPYENLIVAANYVDNKLTQYLNDLDKDQAVITMGISLGTLFAMEAGKRHVQVKSIILAAPFGDFNDHILAWKDHKLLTKFFEIGDDSGRGLVNALESINTTRDSELLKDKEIYISYSDDDKFIRTDATEKLIAHLQKNNIHVTTRLNKGGHFTGILTDYLRFIVHKHDALKFDER